MILSAVSTQTFLGLGTLEAYKLHSLSNNDLRKKKKKVYQTMNNYVRHLNFSSV